MEKMFEMIRAMLRKQIEIQETKAVTKVKDLSHGERKAALDISTAEGHQKMATGRRDHKFQHFFFYWI